MELRDDAHPHFYRIASVIEMERKLIAEVAEKPGLIPSLDLLVLRYALNVARLGLIRTERGDIDVFEQVAPFRHWLVEQLSLFVASDDRRATDWKALRSLAPTMRARLHATRQHLLENNANRISEGRLEREVTHKVLVLVLGGGGGAGYTHLGAFATFHELGLIPDMLVGSSMGSMMGMLRSLRKEYDPALVPWLLPRPAEFPRIFNAYRGWSRFGFPGALELNLQPIATELFHRLLGRGMPRLSELAIPLRPVVTGLRTGIGLAISEVETGIGAATSAIRPLRTRQRFLLFFDVLRRMLANPRFLTTILFGREDGLRDFDAVDAVGFSCSVPAFLHYDIGERDSESAAALRPYFDDRQLFRLTDGGVVANVASRAAWEAVQTGDLTSRNAFIAGFDCFAPLPNSNILFFPVQQIIRNAVLRDSAYADLHVRYRSPPSPVELLKKPESLVQVVAKVKAQLDAHRTYISLMMRPIPAWNQLFALRETAAWRTV